MKTELLQEGKKMKKLNKQPLGRARPRWRDRLLENIYKTEKKWTRHGALTERQIRMKIALT
jgi:hypothetical protein